MTNTPSLNWRTLAGLAAGAAHSQVDRGCEDGFAVAVTAGGQLVAALADGAGSYESTSAYGSSTATRAAVDYVVAALEADATKTSMLVNGDAGAPRTVPEPPLILKGADTGAAAQASVRGVEASDPFVRSDSPDAGTLGPRSWGEQLLLDAMGVAVVAVHERAKDLGLPPEMLSTTLALVVVEGDSAVVAQIGDGVTVLRVSGASRWVVPEEKAGYANLTWFLRPENLSLVRLATVRGVDAVALSSDGLRYQICDLASEEPYAPFFDHLWGMLATGSHEDADLVEYLDQIDNSQASGDDKSLVLAVAVNEPTSPTVKRSPEPAAPSPANLDDNAEALAGADITESSVSEGAWSDGTVEGAPGGEGLGDGPLAVSALEAADFHWGAPRQERQLSTAQDSANVSLVQADLIQPEAAPDRAIEPSLPDWPEAEARPLSNTAAENEPRGMWAFLHRRIGGRRL